MADPEDNFHDGGNAPTETAPLLPSSSAPEPVPSDLQSQFNALIQRAREQSTTTAAAAREHGTAAYAAVSAGVATGATHARSYLSRASSTVSERYQDFSQRNRALFPDTPAGQTPLSRATRAAIVGGVLILILLFAGFIKVAVSPPVEKDPGSLPPPVPVPTTTSEPLPEPTATTQPSPSPTHIPAPTSLPPVPVPDPPPEPVKYCTTPGCIIAASRLIRSIDEFVDPCEDFYQYACGGWEKRHNVPEYTLQTSVEQHLRERNLRTIQTILLNKTTSPLTYNDQTALKGVRHFYTQCLQPPSPSSTPLSLLLRTNLITPTFPLYKSTFPWGKRAVLPQKVALALSALHSLDVPSLFHLSVDSSAYKKHLNALVVSPGRGGILRGDMWRREEVVKVYTETVRDVMEEIVGRVRGPGIGRSWDKVAQGVVEVERALGWAVEMGQGNDVGGVPVHEIELKTLEKMAPAVPWTLYFTERLKDVNVTVSKSLRLEIRGSEGFYTTLSKIMERTDPLVLEEFVLWQAVESYSRYGGEDVQRSFRKLVEVIGGVDGGLTAPPRWEKCTRDVQEHFGHVLGKWFVNGTLNDEKKRTLEQMQFYLKDSLRNQIWHNGWMDYDTSSKAAEKLWALSFHVGTPPPFSTTGPLPSTDFEMDDGTGYFDGVVKAREWRVRADLETVGKVLKRGRWQRDAGVVRVHNDLLTNSVSISSGILRDPIFDTDAPSYLSFGSLGSRLSTEMLRAFEGDGRDFSPQGLVSPWYTFPTLQKFKNITQCYEKEYNATSWVVGKVLIGVGGLDAAVDGWRVERQGLGGAEKNGRLFGVDGKGWSEETGVYLGYATSMCAKGRGGRGRGKVSEYVNTVVSLSEGFAGAFGCKARKGHEAFRKGWKKGVCPALW
ncbi:Endothelin-converting enzyme 1 [Rhizophlyctis rosea]|uniref:Endothelin-converting enzyme 1 n=1 Tax=Rhizophlyctis rosea TaxID=64517 RepID=A0AAD5S4T7_9FUNG|nr:Endothelin-converting enzyme 1 [Rhizophlyctis rosea]